MWTLEQAYKLFTSPLLSIGIVIWYRQIVRFQAPSIHITAFGFGKQIKQMPINSQMLNLISPVRFDLGTG